VSRIPLPKEEAVDFFSVLFCGKHHIPDPGVRANQGGGFYVNVRGGVFWASTDFDNLTRLVFLAHDRCLRAQIDAKGFYIRVTIWKRDPAATSYAEGHPTLEQAAAKWRERNPLPSPKGRSDAREPETL